MRAWDESRSHRVVLIDAGDVGLVVKRHRRGDDIQGSRTREVAAYRAAAAAPLLADLVPAVVADDPPDLVLERVAGTDLAQLRDETSRRDVAPLYAAAAAIGTWHLHASRLDVDGRPVRPWVLDALSPDRPAFLETNAGARGLLERAPRQLGSPLRRLEEAWTPDTFVHGDLRYENVICHGGDVRFIDWECAGTGDPAWDLAALAARVLADAGVREVGQRLAPPTARELAALFSGYEHGAGVAPAHLGDRLGLACSARLLQQAVQVAGATPGEEATAEADRLTGLAAELGSRPSWLPAAVRDAT